MAEVKRKQLQKERYEELESKKIKDIKLKVFTTLKITMLSSKSQKYYKEQENLRRCLKSDLEEKSKLKKRIQDLILESKEKQMRLAELEAAEEVKSKATKIVEHKYSQIHKQTTNLLEENKRLNELIINLKKYQGKLFF